MTKKGYKQTPEHIRKRTECQRGKIVSEETRKKMSISGKSKVFSEEHKKNLSAAKYGRYGDKNNGWKGTRVKYSGLHLWVQKELGRADHCDGEKCSGVSERYEWANISGEYKRDVNDFEWLCRKCHMKKDGRYYKWQKHKQKKI